MKDTLFRAHRRCTLFCAFMFAIGTPAAWAASAVTSQLEVRQVTMESGHEALKPASAARPGDLLQYRATYTNAGNAAAEHLLANLPVPSGTTLQADGMDPTGAQASLDGKQFAPMPLMRPVLGKDGKPHQQPVPLSEIRSLRWDLGTLASHQTRAVQLRVHVNATTTTEPVSKSASPAPR